MELKPHSPFMMTSTNNIDVTATGVSGASEPAVGERCLSQVPKSTQATKSAGNSQAPAANTGVGNVTAGGSATLASSGGRKATDATARHIFGAQDTIFSNTPVYQQLLDSSSSKIEDLKESNARFYKFLDAVYSTTKKLDAEVAAATNTKKEIKTLVSSLSNSMKGLIPLEQEERTDQRNYQQ